ncbi:hypothetical protein D3C76_1536890 [compost metagenome]
MDHRIIAAGIAVVAGIDIIKLPVAAEIPDFAGRRRRGVPMHAADVLVQTIHRNRIVGTGGNHILAFLVPFEQTDA